MRSGCVAQLAVDWTRVYASRQPMRARAVHSTHYHAYAPPHHLHVQPCVQYERVLMLAVAGCFLWRPMVCMVCARLAGLSGWCLGGMVLSSQDCRLMEDSALTDKATRDIFAAVQQLGDDPDGATGSGLASTGGDAELVYSEFLEALAAVACFKMCNPYVPIDQR